MPGCGGGRGSSSTRCTSLGSGGRQCEMRSNDRCEVAPAVTSSDARRWPAGLGSRRGDIVASTTSSGIGWSIVAAGTPLGPAGASRPITPALGDIRSAPGQLQANSRRTASSGVERCRRSARRATAAKSQEARASATAPESRPFFGSRQWLGRGSTGAQGSTVSPLLVFRTCSCPGTWLDRERRRPAGAGPRGRHPDTPRARPRG